MTASEKWAAGHGQTPDTPPAPTVQGTSDISQVGLVALPSRCPMGCEPPVHLAVSAKSNAVVRHYVCLDCACRFILLDDGDAVQRIRERTGDCGGVL